MSQPSQEFPPWLSPSAVVITDAAGNPVATETSIVYIPPTYFGPSIPLGSLYIFGGTTEPASIALPSAAPQTTTTVPPSISTSATPTTTATTILTTSATPTPTTSSSSSASVSVSVSVSSTSATPTSILSISSSASSVSSTASSTSILSSLSSVLSTPSSLPSSSSASIISTPTATVSNTPVPLHASGLTRSQLIGVIVASILGLVFLFVFALFLFLCLKGRKNRRQFATLTPIDEDYYIIPPGERLPGEGSPRHSGEEADPFLQRSRGTSWPGYVPATAAAAAGVGAAAMTQVPSQAASPISSSRVPPPLPVSGSNNGSHSSGSTNSMSNASGFGVLLDRPTLGFLPSMPEHQETGGTPLSHDEMARIGRESVLPDNQDGQYGDPEYTGAFAYSQDLPVSPRLVDSTPSTPLLAGDRPAFTSQPSRLSNKSSLNPSDREEAATLLTARRVKVEDLGPRSTPIPLSSAGPSTGFLGALGGLASNIGRLSWFNRQDSPKPSVPTPPNYIVDPLSEKDLETGRSYLSPDTRRVDSFGNRPRGLGVGADGTRPVSTVSGRSGTSGGTMYHDAQSSLPGTPLLAPPPRAITPAEPMPTEHSWLASPLASPPAYTVTDRPLVSSTPPPSGTPEGSNPNDNTTTDILDMPAPAALDHFASISSAKDSPSASSFGSRAAFFPPGLDTIKAVGWGDSAKSGAAIDISSGPQHQGPIAIDILEQAPPDAEMGWRTMSSGGTGIDHSRRGTFGLFMQGHGISSEQGSLHSMRSHFTPSNRSTGSAPASRHDIGSISSNSSRPSAHSVARSIGSGVSAAAAHSLLRTGSISSDERNRFSPSLSALGHGHPLRTSSGQGSGSGSGSHSHSQGPGHGQEQSLRLVPVIGAPPSVHMTPEKSTTVRSVGSGSPTILDASFETARGPGVLQHERSISPSNTSFSLNAPWVGGLSSDWQASP